MPESRTENGATTVMRTLGPRLKFTTCSIFSVLVWVGTWVSLNTTVQADDSACSQPDRARPNILFFLVDDMGITDTSVRFLFDADGKPIDAPLNTRYRTPNMEKLACAGVRFVSARAYSVCTPTRAALITGQDAARMHITTWTDPQVTADTGDIERNGMIGPEWRMSGVDPAWPTLPRILADAGYRTIHCGKAHFGPNDTKAGDPLNLGFQINIGGHGAGGPGSYLGVHNFSAQWRGGGKNWDVPGLEKYQDHDVFLTEVLTQEMSFAIETAVGDRNPFFAYMAHYAVHAPFEADDRFAKNYPDLVEKDLAFATLVEGMDKSLGDLIAKLETLGVAEETLVVFYSDNGSDGPLNKPLLGKKGTRFDGGSRVPMIVAWAKADPNNLLQKMYPLPAGTLNKMLVTPMDFLPTLAAIGGAEVPDAASFDGFDFSDCFNGKPRADRSENFLLHFPHGKHNDELFTTWLEGDWKLIYQYAEAKWQLTNVSDDIGEEQNLVESRPEFALAMAQRMVARMDQLSAQYPLDKETKQPIKPDLHELEDAVERVH